MGKHSGNRSVRNRIRKRRQRRAIISFILLVVLVIAGTFMWKRSGTNLANNLLLLKQLLKKHLDLVKK